MALTLSKQDATARDYRCEMCAMLVLGVDGSRRCRARFDKTDEVVEVDLDYGMPHSLRLFHSGYFPLTSPAPPSATSPRILLFELCRFDRMPLASTLLTSAARPLPFGPANAPSTDMYILRPALDAPLHAFGTPSNDPAQILYTSPPHPPPSVTVLQTYWIRTEPEPEDKVFLLYEIGAGRGVRKGWMQEGPLWV